MSKLKSCPFCGASNEDIDIYTVMAKYGRLAYIQCELCGARSASKKVEGDVDDKGFWEQRAIKLLESLWNRRIA